MLISKKGLLKHKLSEILGEENKITTDNYYKIKLIANKINKSRNLILFPEKAVRSGELFSSAVMFEFYEKIFEKYFEEKKVAKRTDILRKIKETIGVEAIRKLEKKFLEEFYFPNIEKEPLDKFLEKIENTDDEEKILEKILLVHFFNQNPALENFKELMDNSSFSNLKEYHQFIDALNDLFEKLPPIEPGVPTIIRMMKEPIERYPKQLDKQLNHILKNWVRLVPELLEKLLSANDFLKEEQKIRVGGKGVTPVLRYDQVGDLPEAFSEDQDWMPNVVMIAKNTYVWLWQLSKKYETKIDTLDKIPEEELEKLSKWGINAIWLIGIWERSPASKKIKHLTGNVEAEASAYSIYEYRVAKKLGGDEAAEKLKQKAWKYGIRIATDMVPNHTGIDSVWVIDHPEWFIQTDTPPFPNYSFNGPDLSSNKDVGIFLEDHYYDKTDAAVVFKRVDYRTGETRYIYHGNDGTSMPWNDTAQLNYLLEEVRENVIKTILEIGKRFPIIRFDAAMTLTKMHFQRLWFPLPGQGGDIPSRAEFSMTKEEFDRLMPKEFWREVVDRVKEEGLDTLLLAEAFWLLEGYFVRTLGMHRVYNSAFMNMLRDEENAKFRQTIKNTLEYDPRILQRFVNFMSNPDEETAVKQFGKGDKYFGVCTLLATLPGLPMFAHGQIEGFEEKYGMEYYRPYWEEKEDENLIKRHEKEIFPLLKKRPFFAYVENFRLYDFYKDPVKKIVDENVIAYSNNFKNNRTLVIYNNQFKTTKGTIIESTWFKDVFSKEKKIIKNKLGEMLGLTNEENYYVIFKDEITKQYYIRKSTDIINNGLTFQLRGYEYHVFTEFKEIKDNKWKHYQQLYEFLKDQGVPDINQALKQVILRKVHQVFNEYLGPLMIGFLLENLDNALNPDNELATPIKYHLNKKLKALVAEIQKNTGNTMNVEPIVSHLTRLIENFYYVFGKLPKHQSIKNKYVVPRIIQEIKEGLSELPIELFLIWALLWPLTKGISSDPELATETLNAWIEEWHINTILTTMLEKKMSEENVEIATPLIKTAISYSGNLSGLIIEKNVHEKAREFFYELFSDTLVQDLIGLNTYRGISWFVKERFELLTSFLLLCSSLLVVDVKQSFEANLQVLSTIFDLYEEWRQKAIKAGFQTRKFLEGL